MTKEELALEVIDRLKKEYPDAGCTLDYDQAWKLLVSVRLAAQCTDARVNVVVEDLYAKYPDVASLAKAEPEEIEAIVRPCGLGRSKARDISACMRVALGRAIVKNQKVFLMDEPLSNLDAKLRVSMRTEISRLHREMGATTIYVTHDQVEAMTMADRIVIMKEGVIQQVGKPMELYDHPVNKFVAGFIGSPQMNFFDVTVKGNEVTFKDGNKLTLPEAIINKLNGREGEMTLGIRGEDLKMDAQNLELYKENKMRAVITDTEVMGNENNLYFQFGGCQAVARVSKYEISQVGDEIEFVFMPSKIHFFDKETEVNYL